MRKLTDLAMNSNRLTRVPRFLRSLVPQLKTLDLGDNAIAEVGDDDLSGLGGLYGLRLAGNRISSVGNATFAQVPNVHILNLAHNKVGLKKNDNSEQARAVNHSKMSLALILIKLLTTRIVILSMP